MLEPSGGNDGIAQHGMLQPGTDGRQTPSKKLGSFPVFYVLYMVLLMKHLILGKDVQNSIFIVPWQILAGILSVPMPHMRWSYLCPTFESGKMCLI